MQDVNNRESWVKNVKSSLLHLQLFHESKIIPPTTKVLKIYMGRVNTIVREYVNIDI